MLSIRAAVLYTALLFGANPAAADIAAAEALRAGDMQKLSFSEPQPLPEIGLIGMDDAPRSLSEFRGKWVLVNFWATWCPPCRTEMPSLGALQKAKGSALFEVVTVATGRNSVQGISDFWAEAGVQHLQVLRDPNMALARAMGVAGLPVTVVLNPEGQEVGRLIGDAEWNTPEAYAVIEALQK